MRLRNLLEHLLQDVRFAVRQLRKRPGFTVTAALTLAVGIGASVAIFAFVDAALLKPLPYREPGRLAGVFESVPMFPRSNLSYLDYLDWKRLNTAFSSLAAFQASSVTVLAPDGPQRVPGARVSDDFFRTLGVSPVVGRDFQQGEDLPGAPRTVILSHAAWQNRFGGRAVLGESVIIEGTPHTVVGVLPREFHFAPAEPADFWTTLHADNPCDVRRSCHNMYGVGRLADGVSIDAAAANVSAIAAQLEKQYPDSNRGQGAALAPLSEVIVGDVRPILLALLGGAGLLLLIASLNVAGLLLVRSEGRSRELAVRSALGASSARVAAQLATESVVLVSLCTVLGLGFGWWAIHLLSRLIPPDTMARLTYLQGLGLNGRVLLFAGAIAGLCAALCALTPIVQFAWPGRRGSAAHDARGSAGLTWRRLGSRIVVLELATAMVLLVGASLLGQSLYRLLNEDLGLSADRLLTLRVAAPASYANPEQLAALERRLLDRVTALPGVTSAALTSRPPLAGGNTMWIRVIGRPYNGEHNEVQYREVSAQYLTTLQARLVRGRHLAGDDDASRPPVVIVNQALARKYFAGQDPIGQQLQYAPTSSQPPMEIVGLVADVKEGAIDTETAPTMYVAFAQDPTSNFVLVVRTGQSERSSLLTALAAAVREVDPGLTTSFPRTMTEIVAGSQPAYLRRAAATLVGGFAAAAWLMGVVGLYGVIAYSVSQRTREIGVRMALGAERGLVSRLILREAGWLTAGGLVLGAVASIAAASLIRGLLFGVQSWDVSTLVVVAAGLGGSSLLASYIPARRAAAVNPVEALRAE